MMEVFSAVGGIISFGKALYDYYVLYRTNQRLLDVLSGFCQNLDTSLARLQARERQLTEKPSASLLSIQQDFTNANRWLRANEDNLKSKWTVLDAADKLQDLDFRLMKAFSSKMAVALYESVQENRAATAAISTQIDRLGTDLHSSISVMVRESSSAALRDAIQLLREEEYACRPSSNGQGFSTGEVEKVINQLIDQMASAEIRQSDLESRYGGQLPSAGPSRTTSSSSTRPGSIASFNSSTSNGYSVSTAATTVSGDTKGKLPSMPIEAVGFGVRDPANDMDLVDPVLCSDGIIHDRFTIIIDPDQVDPDTQQRIRILGGVDQLRDAIHTTWPHRAREYQQRREGYRRATLELCGPAGHGKLAEQIVHLSHVLLWDPLNVDLLLRRGLARYRARQLRPALDDFDAAVAVSEREGKGRSVDARRYRALVLETCHRTSEAVVEVNKALQAMGKEGGEDPLALAVRSSLRSAGAEHGGAREDLARAKRAWKTKSGIYTSPVDADNLDLVELAIGWASVSLGQFADASQHFQAALQQRRQLDPYALASRGLADLHTNAPDAFLSLEEAIGHATTHPPLAKSTAHLYDLYFLRGMAYYSKGAYVKALADFDRGLASRPAVVSDTGDFRFVLGCCRAELGDVTAATVDFDMACALKPVERSTYVSQREHYGL